MNKIFLSGRLTRDPEVRYSQSGNAYARVGVAVDRPFSKEKEVDFFNLLAFGKTAEFLGKWFSKGSKLLVEGRVQIENYEDKEGIKRKDVSVVVENVEFADSKKSSDGGGNRKADTGANRSDLDDVPPLEDPPF